MRVVLDTSVLIGERAPRLEVDAAISVVSLAELHFGLLVAKDDDARVLRAARLGIIEARFPDPLALTDSVAREWGRLQAAVVKRGGKPRGRMADLAIGATANVHGAVLLTNNLRDFALIDDLIEVRAP